MTLLHSWDMQNKHFLCYRNVKDLLAQELSVSFVSYVAFHINAFSLRKQRSLCISSLGFFLTNTEEK